MAILTFKYLRELQKSERDSSVLQKIDEGFYAACTKCMQSDSSEAENIKPLIKSILDTRERKIVTVAIQSARSGIKPENLLSEEEALFSKMSDLLKSHRELIVGVLAGKKNEPENARNDAQNSEKAESTLPKSTQKIRALLDIPEFVAEDMRSYGPVSAGNVAELPKRAAEVLINAKVAERLS